MALAPSKAPPGSDNSNKVKIGVAAGCLCVAAGLLAWNFGLFGEAGPPPAPQETPEQREEIQKQVKAQEQATQEAISRPGAVKASP
jgi:hypothetical protein